jgi:hypothetical protein
VAAFEDPPRSGKADQTRRKFSEEEILEDWPAFSVDAGDLAVQKGIVNLQMFSNPSGELGESPEDVSIAGD